MAKLTKEYDKINHKLQNPHYLEKAPVVLISKEKARVNEIKAHISKLEQQKNELLTLA